MECRLKEILDERGMKQKYLAEKTNVSLNSMSYIVRGKTIPTLPVAWRIAKVLGLHIDDIWYEKNPTRSEQG